MSADELNSPVAKSAPGRDAQLRGSLVEAWLALAMIPLALAGFYPSLDLPLMLWAALAALAAGLRGVLVNGARHTAADLPLPDSLFSKVRLCLLASGLLWGAFLAWNLTQASFSPLLPVLVIAGGSFMLLFHSSLPGLTPGLALVTLVPPLAMSLLPNPLAGLPLTLTLGLIAVAWSLAGRLQRAQQQINDVVRSESEQMRGYLDQRRTQLEKLTVELKATQVKREEADSSMRRMAADLGLMQGKSKALADTLERISPIDQITGLDNRRQFESALDAEWRRAGRENKPISLLMIDIDDYAHYLESYGRQSTDTMLKRLAQTLRSYARRAGDITSRYDESRFAILLPGCDARNAERIGETIRKKVEAAGIPHLDARLGKTLTLHAGVATAKPRQGLQMQELIERTESAVYEAGFQGGNRMVAYQPLRKIKLERWDQATDGPLSEQSLVQKILVWGYNTKREVLPLGTRTPDTTLEHETVLGLLTGEIRLEVEGHSMTLKAGDCVLIPKGTDISLEVVGTRPVVRFMADGIS